MKATLDQGGRIELPAVVQAELGAKPGDELSFEPLEGAGVIRLVANAGIPINTATADDDLDWPELEYESPSPKCVGEASVEFEYRGPLNTRAIRANYPEVVLAY